MGHEQCVIHRSARMRSNSAHCSCSALMRSSIKLRSSSSRSDSSPTPAGCRGAALSARASASARMDLRMAGAPQVTPAICWQHTPRARAGVNARAAPEQNNPKPSPQLRIPLGPFRFHQRTCARGDHLSAVAPARSATRENPVVAMKGSVTAPRSFASNQAKTACSRGERSELVGGALHAVQAGTRVGAQTYVPHLQRDRARRAWQRGAALAPLTPQPQRRAQPRGCTARPTLRADTRSQTRATGSARPTAPQRPARGRHGRSSTHPPTIMRNAPVRCVCTKRACPQPPRLYFRLPSRAPPPHRGPE